MQETYTVQKLAEVSRLLDCSLYVSKNHNLSRTHGIEA